MVSIFCLQKFSKVVLFWDRYEADIDSNTNHNSGSNEAMQKILASILADY